MFVDPPPKTQKLDDLLEWCEKLQQKILEDDLFGSATWDASSIADGDEEEKDVTVTGAVLGDYAIASLSIDIGDTTPSCLTLSAHVTADDVVTCVLSNNTGGAVDLASATVYVRVFKRVQ